MSNFFIHQITLYHLNENDVERVQYPNVYFRHVVGIKDFTKGVMTDCSRYSNNTNKRTVRYYRRRYSSRRINQ